MTSFFASHCNEEFYYSFNKFQHFQKLREHIEINHSASKPWKCEIENCDFTHAKKWGITAHMKNAVHLPPEAENSSENDGSTPPKRGRRPGTPDHDESKITHGPGICPHCEKVSL